MIGADAAFAAAANAAATAFAATPAHVAYRLTLRAQRGTTRRDEKLEIVFHRSDGTAIIKERDDRQAPAPPPALPPEIDALAQWAFSLDDVGGRVVMRVAYEHPKRYAFATPGPDADVVVPSILGYAVRYADDDATHLQLTPATPEARASAGQADRFFYRDVFVDPTTSLPRRVVLVAPDETLTLDYAVQKGAWLLAHVTYDAVDRSQHRSNERLTLDADYDNYVFSAEGAP